MKIVSPSPLMGEGGGEGESKPLPPHLNPLPRRGVFWVYLFQHLFFGILYIGINRIALDPVVV
jgi:hypothetical protein